MNPIRFATVRTGMNIVHIAPGDNSHTRCGRVVTVTVENVGAWMTAAPGRRVCKSCAKARTFDRPTTDTATDTWTVTNKAGEEITRFVSTTSLGVTALIRADADCGEWIRLEGRVSKRRLLVSQL